jgi:uncharacterized protein YjbI with pentapeptide repeats
MHAVYRPHRPRQARYRVGMANPEHLAILKEGVATWTQWRMDHYGVEVDLSGADLKKAYLIGWNLKNANLSAANLNQANLIRADLRGANLNKAYLMQADLGGAHLNNANLSGAHLEVADLKNADLTLANLRGASIGEADASHARVGYTNFGDIDLSQVKGLLSIRHNGPSTIGIDTMYKSKGNIPEEFLRGAGVPEPFITNMKALVGAMEPIQFYSCFISYSTKDQDFAERLYADLQSKGVRCWFAPHDIQGGKKIHEQIDEAIRLYDRLLLVLSPNSMNSEWVNTEIAKARKREIRDKHRMLFPVRLVDFETLSDWECFDADTGKDSAREIREYFIPDFSRWKDHDSYQTAFQRLMSDLKAEAGGDITIQIPPARGRDAK